MNAAGRRLIDVMQKQSLCPTSGVLGHCMPTTWTQCGLDCPGRKSSAGIDQRCSDHSNMVNVNDLVFVDADLIVNALLSSHPSQVFRLVSRRIEWASKIDHAVTYGHFQVSPAGPASCRVMRRDRLRRQLKLHFKQRFTLFLHRLSSKLLLFLKMKCSVGANNGVVYGANTAP